MLRICQAEKKRNRRSGREISKVVGLLADNTHECMMCGRDAAVLPECFRTTNECRRQDVMSLQQPNLSYYVSDSNPQDFAESTVTLLLLFVLHFYLN